MNIDGLYADIVRELMTTIFRLQDEEDREEATDEKDMKGLQSKENFLKNSIVLEYRFQNWYIQVKIFIITEFL